MDNMSGAETPFSNLGDHLRYVRTQSKQSLAEVSGAVEIEEGQLERIEAGLERPAEDILLLLISHFGVKDREAVQLWELAEYESDLPAEIKLDGANGKQMTLLLAIDVRTIYSDSLEVAVNPSGVTLQFGQAVGNSQTTPVARVGMSHQQAEMVVKTLQQALLQAKYGGKRLLPPSTEV
jgi:transcriptional regulator with XRE-family HTH domain